MAKIVRYRSDDEWSALYVDGELDKRGDHDVVDERISELLSVENRYSNDFLIDDYTVHDTLADIESAAAQRAQHIREAELLEERAHEFLKQAQELRGQ